MLIGWGLRYLQRLSESVPVILQASLAGAVLLTVLKEELPESGQSRYSAFAAGALGYAAPLMAF